MNIHLSIRIYCRLRHCPCHILWYWLYIKVSCDYISEHMEPYTVLSITPTKALHQRSHWYVSKYIVSRLQHQHGWCGDIHDDVIKWKHFPRHWPFVIGELPAQKVSDAELWCFLWSAPEPTVGKQWRRRWFEMPSPSLWRYSKDHPDLPKG